MTAADEARSASGVLLVTGMAGAGKTTVLKTLEDLGWETVDNLPQWLIDRLLEPDADGATQERTNGRRLAIGIGSRTRDFDPDALIRRIETLRNTGGANIGALFLDCSADELVRRYGETRHRHPLGEDRPAVEAIEEERALLAPLRGWANRLIDTTECSTNELSRQIRDTFGDGDRPSTTLTIMSFGFSRGVPRGVDMVFDMRFLRNPHWAPELRPRTGRDSAVADYIAQDPAYGEALARIEELLLFLVPRYGASGKPYVTIAFGCTGGKHRSVHVAERVARRLRDAGFSPTINHRDLAVAAQDSLEGQPRGE